MEAKLYINGLWEDTAEHIEVENPATKERVGTVSKAGVDEARKAVSEAHQALSSWKAKTAAERAQILMNWYKLIDDHKKSIARIMTLEQGKPIKEAIGEVLYANSFVSWYAEEGKRIYGETVPASDSNKRILVIKQPVGVIAAITPWNFPAAMLTRKVAPALAAGCTAVVKPSELTPFTAYKLVELAHEAGIPPGVINVITGDPKEIGAVWMADERVSKISFTGSTPVGKLLMRQASETVKKVSLELGGQAPFIITKYANIDLAVEGIMNLKFKNAGQTCICPNRVYVHDSIHDEFIQKLTEEVNKLKVGNGLDEGVDLGPLINQDAVKKVEHHVTDALNRGAIITTTQQEFDGNGYFVQPMVLSNVSDEMICTKEETFGPIVPVTTFSSTSEVIERANHSQYGLAAYVFTQDIKEAFTISEGLEFGIIGLNDGAPIVAQAPFGGMKESGLGREGGHWGIDEFLEVKYISLNLA